MHSAMRSTGLDVYVTMPSQDLEGLDGFEDPQLLTTFPCERPLADTGSAVPVEMYEKLLANFQLLQDSYDQMMMGMQPEDGDRPSSNEYPGGGMSRYVSSGGTSGHVRSVHISGGIHAQVTSHPLYSKGQHVLQVSPLSVTLHVYHALPAGSVLSCSSRAPAPQARRMCTPREASAARSPGERAAPRRGAACPGWRATPTALPLSGLTAPRRSSLRT